MEHPTCNICRKTFASKDSLRVHRKKQHNVSQTGKGPTIAIVPKSNEEIANEDLDNNKDLYDEEEWKDLKRKFKDDDEPTPYRSKDPRSIKCRLCSKKVLSKQDLAIHMEEQHPTCLYCRKRFPTKREFEKHHHPTCHICDKVVLTEKALNEHLKIHPKCQRCGEIFLNEAQLKIHMMNSHKAGKRLHEDVDSDSTISATKEIVPLDDVTIDMDSDVLSDYKDDVSILSIDSAGSISTLSINKDIMPLDDIDMQSIGGDSASTVSASKEVIPLDIDDGKDLPYEARTFEISSDVSSVKSITSNLSDGDDLKKCRICFRRFVYQSELDNHMAEHVRERRGKKEKRLSSKKNKKKPWEKLACHLCNKKFISQQLLDKHIDREHSYPDGPKIKCPKCHQKFASKRLLERHIREKHDINFAKKKHENPHKDHHVCHYCGRHLETQELLDEHIELKHRALNLPKPSEDAYECQVCKRVLKTKEGYLEHIRNHRPNCTVCAAHFKTTEDRDIHMSLEHPRCMLCDIPFATPEDYMQHKLNVHPENRAYNGPDLPSDPEDELDTDEDSIDLEDRQFHKHIDCVSIEKFLEIHELIEQNQFDTLSNDVELLDGLQVIFKGVIKGYIPLCSPQRMILTKGMKQLLYNFGTDPSAGILMRNKKNLKQLFRVLWDSVKLVIDNYMKYAKK